ncbi:MAG: dihydropteroate synthase [Bacteroidia bacterium]
MAQDTVFYQKTRRIFEQRRAPMIMGILNITPDSFSDGGKYTTEETWLKQAEKMISEGAEIIDIGGCSTRPGAEVVSPEEELRRLIPAIQSVRKNFPEIIISADTYRAGTAKEAVKAGADMINDISGGTMDDEMFRTVAGLKVPYILMHIRGTPQTMQLDPVYNDVVSDVLSWINDRLTLLRNMGVRDVIIDPGFGFGKTVKHNFQLLKNLGEFTKSGCPVMVGLSRKSMINKILNINTKDSVTGTSVLNHIAVQNGASILRVHDVKEAKQVIMLENYLNDL